MPSKHREHPAQRPLSEQVQAVLAELQRLSSPRIREAMAPRYGIHTDRAFGVAMNAMQKLAKGLGRNHTLAAALWKSGWYEARIVAAFIDDPAQVTAVQMDRWCRDFDNWGICDTVCFHLFDQTPHAFRKVVQWARRRDEFVRRAAFALLACLALHDRHAGNERFVEGLILIETASTDERNFVKKAVLWALRAIGERHGELHAAALSVSQRLANSPDATARWVGKGALRELTGRAAAKRLALKSRR